MKRWLLNETSPPFGIIVLLHGFQSAYRRQATLPGPCADFLSSSPFFAESLAYLAPVCKRVRSSPQFSFEIVSHGFTALQ
jgi:hypothetical protein